MDHADEWFPALSGVPPGKTGERGARPSELALLTSPPLVPCSRSFRLLMRRASVETGDCSYPPS
ncbi:MAG: hypothetical protein KatS3mg059_0666 [Thermomicrobiales bacterium]|nr:MAG: hypothetical protein KatS3mg059_0666 [Thermomicrobiales bacterium]